MAWRLPWQIVMWTISSGQRFWGQIVAGTGAGPAPIPYPSLNPRRLTAAIRYCVTDEAQAAAREIGKRLRAETPGSVNAARSFHQNLPMRQMRCDYFPDQPAVWSYVTSKQEIQLSKAAASVLVSHGRVHEQHLKVHRIKTYDALETGTSHSLMNVIIAAFVAILSGGCHFIQCKEYDYERIKLISSSSFISNHIPPPNACRYRRFYFKRPYKMRNTDHCDPSQTQRRAANATKGAFRKTVCGFAKV